MKTIEFVEDCLLVLASMHEKYSIDIDQVDKTLLNSLGRQMSRGLALTDRQHELAKQKIEYYRSQFESLDIDIDQCMDNLKRPLREIDRRQFIKIEKHKDEDKICVRFPFNKTRIMTLQKNIKEHIPNDECFHEKGTQKHYFTINEKTVYLCVKTFINKNFEIDKDLIDIYNELEAMNNNKDKYIGGVYNFKLCNLKDKAVDALISDVGELPNQENLALYKDRKDLFALDYFDEKELERSLRELDILTQKIVNRSGPRIFVSSKKYNINKLIFSLWELNRFPILVGIDSTKSLEYLKEFHDAVSGLIPNEQQTVLFRLDNDTNKDFNDYIKNNGLNNTLDKNIKVVYIHNNKMPKPLIKSDWQPKASVHLGYTYTHRRYLIENDTDLTIYYDEVQSPTVTNFLQIKEI